MLLRKNLKNSKDVRERRREVTGASVQKGEETLDLEDATRFTFGMGSTSEEKNLVELSENDATYWLSENISTC